VLIWYRVNGGSYKKVNMVNISGQQYAGYIPKQPSGSTIQYYLYAADRSGHNAVMPFMGPADPFTFTAIYTDITAIPDTLWFRTMDDLISGKATRLHNYTSAGIFLNSVQSAGSAGWWVDSLSVTAFPHLMNASDSEYVHVRFAIPTAVPLANYTVDTMQFVTELGMHRVIIMFNDSLYTGIPAAGQKSSLAISNYPNPFTSVTSIRYGLPERTSVMLEILNTFGKVIASPVNSIQDAGIYELSYDAGSLPSGIYYLRIITEKETVTKKMLRIR
jgi:hypothetical protein